MPHVTGFPAITVSVKAVHLPLIQKGARVMSALVNIVQLAITVTTLEQLSSAFPGTTPANCIIRGAGVLLQGATTEHGLRRIKRMRRHIFYIIVFLLVTSTGFVAGNFALLTQLKASALSKHEFTPFTATVATNWFKEGSEIPAVSEESTIGIRSDGSRGETKFRWLLTEGHERGVATKALTLLSEGRYISLHPAIQAKSTMALKASEVAILQAKRSTNCADSAAHYSSIEPDAATINGLATYRLVSEVTDVDGNRRVVEEFRAPQLNCFSLSTSQVVYDPQGKVTSRMTKVVKSLRHGDPTDNLFVVPDEYQERTPSEVLLLTAQARGESLTAECERNTANRADQKYHARKF